ncbi:MAG: hypothetical protein ACRDTG_02520 [Pseudonocardiaceae bacterium]
MRSIGYAAVVAAGLIVPLALVLPTAAGAQSLALSGVSHFVSSSDIDDDNESGAVDDSSESPESDAGGAAESDAEDGSESADLGYESLSGVTVYGAGLSSSGDTAFVVRASDVGAFDIVTLSSPALDTGCVANNLTGATAQADRFGNVIFSAQAAGCIPGTYKIAVTEPGEQTYYGDVAIR